MIELIPAIDIIDGRCVRLKQGSYLDQTRYDRDPVELAVRLESIGIRRLHLVDLDGARKGSVVNLEILREICSKTGLVVDFGGGLQTGEDVARVFAAGARMVTFGSLAVRDRDMFLQYLSEYGPEKIILGADARNRRISIQGWQEDTDEDLFRFIAAYRAEGVQKLICTDIARDGMLEGPATGLYQELRSAFPDMEIIASGGVKEMEDIFALERSGMDGIIFGKALFEGKIMESDIVQFLHSR